MTDNDDRTHLRLHRPTPDALEDWDSDDLAEVRRQGLEQVQAYQWGRVIPSRFLTARIDWFDGGVASLLQDWGQNPRGRNLVLFGATGTGKTTAAVAACRLAFNAGLDLRFMPVVEMLDLLRPGGPPGAFYDLADVDILVLDDLGTEKPTEWTAERLYALVNRRWLETAAIVATTNLEADLLEKAVGKRVFSRLVGNDAVVVQLGGQDRRRAKP